jgi:hypothetical protein
VSQRDYAVLGASDLGGPWSNLFSADGNDESIVFTNSVIGSPQYFYRVEVQP